MLKRVQNFELRRLALTAITPEIEVLIGTSPPPIIGMPLHDLFSALSNRTIHIGFCGLKFDSTKMSLFDTTYPPYTETGYQIVDNAIDNAPAILELITSIFATIDNQAILITYLILISSILFGFVIYITEITLAPYTSQFRKDFSEGSQDGVWYSFIVMTTVGFGDLAPKTAMGRLFSVFWIFGSMMLTALLYADIVGNFNGISLLSPSAGASILGPDDLSGLLIGVTDPLVATELVRRVPGIKTAVFGGLDQVDLFNAVLNGTVDMAVERSEIVQYTNNQDPNFQGLLLPAGRVFYREDVVFGVARRADGSPHAIYSLLSVALAEATRLDVVAQNGRWNKWFGDANRVNTAAAGQLAGTLEDQAVDSANAFMVQIVAACIAVWLFKTAALLALRFPSFRARYQACVAVRALLDVRPLWDRVVRDGSGRAVGKKSEAEVRDEVCVALATFARSQRDKSAASATDEHTSHSAPSTGLAPNTIRGDEEAGDGGEGEVAVSAQRRWMAVGRMGSFQLSLDSVKAPEALSAALGTFASSVHIRGSLRRIRALSAVAHAARADLPLDLAGFAAAVAARAAERLAAAPWWMRAVSLDFKRDGENFVMDLVKQSCRRRGLWGDRSHLSIGDAAEVVVDLLAVEGGGWATRWALVPFDDDTDTGADRAVHRIAILSRSVRDHARAHAHTAVDGMVDGSRREDASREEGATATATMESASSCGHEPQSQETSSEVQELYPGLH